MAVPPLPTDRSFNNVIIYDSEDKIAHTRCVIKLRRVDDSLAEVGRVYLPHKWDPVQYEPHDSHQVAMVEHTLECIHEAEKYALQVSDEKLQKELLEDIYMRRLLFYDLLDVIQLSEKKAKLKEKESRD